MPLLRRQHTSPDAGECANLPARRRSLDEDADNVLRNAFNEKLRERVAGEPLFDLAKVESTRADGSSSSFAQGGQQQHSLAQEYTDDGGHLNALGRRRAAIEFVRVLAGALSGNP